MTIRDLFTHRVFTVANLLTFSRIILLFPLWYFIMNEEKSSYYQNISMGIAITMIATDFFDGYLARKLGQESALGQYLDPVADKVTILAGIYMLYLKKDYPLWLFLFIVFREVYGSFFGAFLLLKRNTLGKPSLWGKAGVFFISISALWYLGEWPYQWIADIPVVVTLTGGLISYSMRYSKTIFNY